MRVLGGHFFWYSRYIHTVPTTYDRYSLNLPLARRESKLHKFATVRATKNDPLARAWLRHPHLTPQSVPDLRAWAYLKLQAQGFNLH